MSDTVNPPPPNKYKSAEIVDLAIRHSNVLALIALIVIAGVASPYFFEWRNIMNFLRGSAPLALVAIGTTIVILSRGIDLSVGSLVGVSATVVAAIIPFNPVLAVTLALVSGLLLGAVNGFLITRFNLQPFIATLAMLISGRGIVYMYTEGSNIVVRDPPKWFSFIGSGYVGPFPTPVVIAVAAFICMILVMRETQFGRHVYGIGANEEACKLFGINVKGVTLRIYMLSGLLSALAGIILVSRLTVAEPNAGHLMELDAISATLIGGTTFTGGIGSLGGTVIGVLVLAILGNTLNLVGISPFLQMFLQGVIIVIAVLMSEMRQKVLK
ncbi:ABC transporter permease [Hoeflea sp. G2-23]|uniref:ABC transporter permease n=1 Tax=Hoeflea algicola TaxID=2983763 RepID=A0ABT3ZDK5_9HYPH|nr:ABC transporter permease [Hoeflea algicola]MCY0149819.1 ABC transporter permease [Hoeflea algicola]